MQKDNFWTENHPFSMNTWRKKYFRNCHNNGISFYSHVAWEVNLKTSSISWNLPAVSHGQDTKVHFNRKFVSHRISLGIFLWSSEKTSATCPKVPDKASLTCWEVSSVCTHTRACVSVHISIFIAFAFLSAGSAFPVPHPDSSSSQFFWSLTPNFLHRTPLRSGCWFSSSYIPLWVPLSTS